MDSIINVYFYITVQNNMFYDATVGASAAHDLNMYIRIITINNFFKSMVSLKDAKKISK